MTSRTRALLISTLLLLTACNAPPESSTTGRLAALERQAKAALTSTDINEGATQQIVPTATREPGKTTYRCPAGSYLAEISVDDAGNVSGLVCRPLQSID